MNLDRQSILFKITIFVVVLITIAVTWYFFYQNFDRKERYCELQGELLQENNLNLKQIAYLSERIINNDNTAKTNCLELITVYELNLSVLRTGGSLYGYENDRILEPAESYIIKNIVSCESEWKNYKEKILKIVNENLYVYVRTAKDSIIDGELKNIVRSKKIINPTIENAKKDSRNLINEVTRKNLLLIEIIRKKQDLEVTYKSVLNISTIIFFVLAVFSGYIFLYRNLFKRLNYLKVSANNLLSGNNGESSIKKLKDEIQPIIDNIEEVSSKIVEISGFVQHLEEGNLDARLSEYEKKNNIQTALIKLRDKLKKSKEEENLRKEQEDLRQWAVNGQANFNEIMRRSSSNLQVLVDDLTKEIVYFLNATQGGLFLYVENNEQKYLELKSSFAYDRKKFINKKVELGDTLIGMCALEKNTIYIEEIPEDYIEVESGLGDASPRSLLIIPLKTKSDLLGVLELASFKRFEKHEVEFVERLAETVASTLETAKISAHTGELLEETKKKSDELAARDKEMTENIKELRAAQDQAKTKEAEMGSILMAVDQALLKAELSVGGNFMTINILYQEMLGYHLEEIQNKLIQDVFDTDTRADFMELWKNVLNGETVQTTHKQITKRGKEVWLLSQYTPVIDESKKILHILYLGNDISLQKEIEDNNKRLLEETIEKAKLLSERDDKMRETIEELKKSEQENYEKQFEVISLLTAIDNTLIKAEYNIRGTLIAANQKFLETWKCNRSEIINRNIRNYIPEYNLPVFEKTWSNLRTGSPFNGTFEMLDSLGNTLWLSISFTPVEGNQEQNTKIVFLANNITAQREAEHKLEEISKEIEGHQEQVEKTINRMVHEQTYFMQEIERLQMHEKSLEKRYDTEQDTIYRKWLESLK